MVAALEGMQQDLPVAELSPSLQVTVAFFATGVFSAGFRCAAMITQVNNTSTANPDKNFFITDYNRLKNEAG